MEQKKILITYFDKFCLRKDNYSKIVGKLLVEKLKCDSIMLKVKWFGVKDLTELQKYIEENKPEIIVAMGEIGVCKHNIQLERVKSEDNNNFMRPTLENNINVVYTKEKGIQSRFSSCLKVRNYLHRNAEKYKYVWEFIHINRECESVKDIVDTIFCEVISLSQIR